MPRAFAAKNQRQGSMRCFTIDVLDLRCHEALRPQRRRFSDPEDIRYSASLHDRIAQPLIFCGPNIRLDTGVYLFSFEGRVDGALAIEFTAGRGKVRLKTATITDFSDPQCLVITTPVTEFEVRGSKTDSLETLNLESISVDCLAAPGGLRDQ